MEQQCLFCEIASGQTPSYKVYEDQAVLAFLDRNPGTRGHVIIIPKKHYMSVFEMATDEYTYLFGIVRQVAIMVMKAMKAEGINILYSAGAQAGQRVPHVFIHIIPRYKEDKVAIGWEPLKLSEEDLQSIMQQIHQQYPSQGQPVEQAPIQPLPQQPQPAPEPTPEPEEPIELEEDIPRYW